MHIKDVTDSTKAGHAIELGRGKIGFRLFGEDDAEGELYRNVQLER